MLKTQSGTSMIEVLIAIVIVVLGLLGLAGLQAHATLAEMEAFQRAQAIVLLQDMVDRINADRKNTLAYPATEQVGTGEPLADCGAMNGHARDLCEWNRALQGAAEASSGGAKVGAMVDARGCITKTKADMPREFEVAVVWQGSTATKAPTTACGQGLYGSDDKRRRALVATVVIGCLQNDPATTLCITP